MIVLYTAFMLALAMTLYLGKILTSRTVESLAVNVTTAILATLLSLPIHGRVFGWW